RDAAREAARAERAACEARAEDAERAEHEATALRLLLEEELGRTEALLQQVDYLGHLLEDGRVRRECEGPRDQTDRERQAQSGAEVMRKALGLSRPTSPEREGEVLSVACAKVRQSTDAEAPSLQSYLADVRSRSPSLSRRRNRAPHCTLEEFLGEKPACLANVTASTRAAASIPHGEVEKASFLELIGWKRCPSCNSLTWATNDVGPRKINGKSAKHAKGWSFALQEPDAVSTRGRSGAPEP
ncbi:unnamed protein product, partial [Effrenium voratum]